MIGSVVVLYNPSIDEIENINIYLADVDFAVVVDNSQTDHEEQVLSILTYASKICYYSEKKNLGLCKALNIGVDILFEKGCRWALLLDADSKLGSNIVKVYKKAIEEYQKHGVALFAPVHVFDRSNNKPYTGYKSVDCSMTSGWLVNIEIFKKQNGFFEELFVDGLDMDYCFKSHENSYDVIECGEAIIYHHPAETKNFMGFKYGIREKILPFPSNIEMHDWWIGLVVELKYNSVFIKDKLIKYRRHGENVSSLGHYPLKRMVRNRLNFLKALICNLE